MCAIGVGLGISVRVMKFSIRERIWLLGMEFVSGGLARFGVVSSLEFLFCRNPFDL